MFSELSNYLHQFAPVRRLAKKILRRTSISQSFYNGKIVFNSVDFSFLWTNNKKAECHDRDVQDQLLNISRGMDLFIDIGANIGIMTLSVALRNPEIEITAYEPNKLVRAYLERSVHLNGLDKRVKIMDAAVSDYEGSAKMNFSLGSYAGHLSTHGEEVRVHDFKAILKAMKGTKVVFKLDIEGFETVLIPIISEDKNPEHVFVIEMHPKGMNQISDPERNIDILLANGFVLHDVKDQSINEISQVKDWDNIICRYAG